MKHLQYKYSILFFAIFAFAKPLYAQKQVTHQSMYWIRYYGKYQFSPKWGATLEFEDRRFFHDNRQLNLLLPRVAVTRSLGSGWNAALGFTYFLAANPGDGYKPIAVTAPELRPHEELSYKQKIKDLTISHRYRLEERFVRKSDADHLLSGYNFNFRFRYQLQLQYPLIKKETAAGTLNIKVSDEPMLNFGHSIVRNFFDQNRFYVALNYGISKSIQVELGYINWFQERSSGDQYYDRDIARFTFYHSVNFARNRK